jgi:adenylate cyclase
MASGEDPHSKVTTGMRRKLAAILSADVAEYSRLMEEDEEATIRTVTAYREVIATLVRQHHGRVVDSPGDNLLAEFASVVDAVQCAVAIQRELHARNTVLPLRRRMQFRLGINLGDVIAEGEQIYGNGVNIAARLENLAEAGGICISGTVYDQIATRLALGYKFLGERVVKNITRPVRVYRVETESGSPGLKVRLRNRLRAGPWPRMAFVLVGLLLILGGGVASWQLFVYPLMPKSLPDKPSIAVSPFVNMSGDSTQEYFSNGMTEDLITDMAITLVGLLLIFGVGVASWRLFLPPSLPVSVTPTQKTAMLALPDKPSIAVLPFVNMSEESMQEYFSDGLTEDLITDLARLGGLFVIARNSVYTYKGKPVRPEQVSRELGVRYIIEGSVRKANDRVRITAQLIDATTGYHLWAERYDRDLRDIFAVQEEIARRITAALAVQLTPKDEQQLGQRHMNNLEAWDAFTQGTALYRQYTKEANAEARKLFEKAIDLDPQFAMAYAHLAATYRQDWNYEWTADLPAAEQRVFELAQRSVALDPSLPYGHVQLAYIYVYRRQHDDAIREAEHATQLGGANDADGYAVLAQVLTYGGEPQRAVPLMEKALSLDPRAPVNYLRQLGQAYYVIGQIEKYQKGDAQKAQEYYQKAEEHLTRAIKVNRNHRQARLSLVPVYMESGQEPKARELFAQFPDMHRHITISQRRQQAPYKDPAMRERYIDALRRAGSSGGTP